MNISYFVPSLRRKGPTYQLLYLLGSLNKSNSIVLVVLNNDTSDTLDALFREISNLQIIDLKSSVLKEMISLNKKFKSIVDEFNIDLIHTQGLHTDFLWSFFKVKGKKHVCTLRNDPYVDYKDKFGFLPGFLIAYLHILIVSKFTDVVCCSYFLKNQWSSYVKKNFHVIHNSIDLERFVLTSEFNENELKIVNLIKTEKSYTYVGSLINRKNISYLIDVFKALRDQNYHLFIIGSGPLYHDLHKMSSDNVHFVGHISNPERLLRYSKYFISASLSEGLPNSVLEAMALKVPVVLSSIPSHMEIFSGFDYNQFFNVNSRESLIDLLISHETLNSSDLVDCYDQILNGKFIPSITAGNYQEYYNNL